MAKESSTKASQARAQAALASAAAALPLGSMAVMDPPSSDDASSPLRDGPQSDGLGARKKRKAPLAATHGHSFAARRVDDDPSNRQAELFYLQKQIQQQTQMVFILEDGERVQGIIEWYDRHSIKVRGKARVLIYKAAIKYLYKAGEIGSAPEK